MALYLQRVYCCLADGQSVVNNYSFFNAYTYNNSRQLLGSICAFTQTQLLHRLFIALFPCMLSAHPFHTGFFSDAALNIRVYLYRQSSTAQSSVLPGTSKKRGMPDPRSDNICPITDPAYLYSAFGHTSCKPMHLFKDICFCMQIYPQYVSAAPPADHFPPFNAASRKP